ncbi:CPBP family intramembrane glutamic endopeptidase [Corynebacterium guangdongense]|uniref:Membrane protease YdiL (CAAX protease family) n=1 Tax=Corynebacterium guangdongense TaxID=1783348 RepID=A0ABU2A0P6_9CORY|nr:CPBP family intramembrane glutamic endopeptidase [Corynebacterium guangdongense]MDR7330744.1 membrane protease YdiL (CAAX protease family) [Corynebacterium guangdongense]WJZ16759.1 CAAX amino terminal protease self- immunity [Corynebacterium guangdongense]
MSRLFARDQLRHFFLWLTFYLLLSVAAVNIGLALGWSVQASAAPPLGALAVVLALYLWRTGIGKRIGLGVPADVPARRVWFHLPLLLLVALPLAFGFRTDLAAPVVGAVLAHALFVGFLEEVLFRGMLLQALLQKNRPVWAVMVSALTFGVGHAFSLLIGQGAEDTALQIVNATVVGLIFTLVVMATGNLHAVIVAHVLYNAVAALARPTDGVVHVVAGAVVLVVYGGWLLYGAGVRDRLRVAPTSSAARPR